MESIPTQFRLGIRSQQLSKTTSSDESEVVDFFISIRHIANWGGGGRQEKAGSVISWHASCCLPPPKQWNGHRVRRQDKEISREAIPTWMAHLHWVLPGLRATSKKSFLSRVGNRHQHCSTRWHGTEQEPVVLDNCWDLIPWRNKLGIDSYEELGWGTDSPLAL